MIAVMSMLVFVAALTASIAVFGWTLLPAMPRIVALLRTGIDPHGPALSAAIVSEQRLRSRVRAFGPARPAWREAA